MRLLIVGTGGMAKSHAEHFAKIEGVVLAGAVDVDPDRVAAFAKTHGIARTFTSLDEAIAWGQFDASTNVTPDRAHYPTVMKLVAAGKPMMCEKPLAEDFTKADEMATAVEAAGLINMVNLSYRNVAPLQKAREMVLAGEIGTIRHVEASYLQSWLVSKAWGDWRTESQWLWRLSSGHGSNGVLGDIGIHILDFAAYAAGTEVEQVFATLRTFDKAPGGRIGDYVLDANDSFTMSVDFANGALGVVHASRWATGHLNDLRLRIYGEKGGLEVVHRPSGSELNACLGPNIDAAVWENIPVAPVPTNYDRFVAAIRDGQPCQPDFRHAASLQRILDQAQVSHAERRQVPC